MVALLPRHCATAAPAEEAPSPKTVSADAPAIASRLQARTRCGVDVIRESSLEDRRADIVKKDQIW
jgi:hypothetical protein